MEYLQHKTVLLDEVLSFVQTSIASIPLNAPFLFADLTFGGGGHTYSILEKFPNSLGIGIDQDWDALKNAEEKLKDLPLSERLLLLHSNFIHFEELLQKNEVSTFLNKNGIQKKNANFNFILMDLGISTHQLMSSQRGLSFKTDGPLDMRMNQFDTQFGITAYDIINDWSEEDLAEILYTYGEESLSRKIAKHVVARRNISPIKTTKELEDVIFHVYPSNRRHGKSHPATKTFQALRVVVNQEIKVLKNALPKLLNCLNNSGILSVISFHSIEDRIVKHFFKEEYLQKKGIILSKKPISPSKTELQLNNRSRSAKLRAFQKNEIV